MMNKDADQPAPSTRRFIRGFYPGTFDPVTNGHINIIVRAARLVDHLYVGVASNTQKRPLLSLHTRMECIRHELADVMAITKTPVEVIGFGNLLVDCAREHDAHIIFRGLRGHSDFDYEDQMFGMNQWMAPDIETVYLFAAQEHRHISSRLVKEVAALKGDIAGMVPEFTYKRIYEALDKGSEP
ncbi:pantetheine-phosphate adenylyltransferase [Entomobacter blattae]|uniref:Phosphopantetheine adenylyltransferase n=1 Tax=Entomobacter blattae TaxID=2762277 RepID=A0A7H1NU93_9PROT|nr:pantetheine-phosphate adenylyltransferase [Entomobacter blattae]QNT79353.1 Phosphopantetheine adenylyltransferase [Entomobacter blattae]